MKAAGKILKGLGIAILALVLLFVALYFILLGTLFYQSRTTHYDATPDENGFAYLCRDGLKKRAAATEVYYDLDSESNEIVVPETYGGRPVVALGGYVGHGGGCPFDIRIKNISVQYRIDASEGSFSWYAEPKSRQTVYVDLILRIGPNIREIFADQGGFDTYSGLLYVPRVYIICDPENESFYSEDGRLYQKNGELVEGFIYWDKNEE